MADQITEYLEKETAAIERGPIHMRAIRAGTMMRDWEKKEALLAAWAASDDDKPAPFGGQISAIDAARCINHFAALKQKWSAEHV